jgi:hypothetical protein
MDGKYVETSKSLDYSWECSLATQRFAAFFVRGISEQKASVTKLRIVPSEKTQLQGKRLSEINRYLTKIRFCYRHYTCN